MDISGTYDATATLGEKSHSSTVKLTQTGDELLVEFEAPVVGKVSARGTMTSSDSFSATGSIRVLVKKITYNLTGRVHNDTLIAVCETNMGTAEVLGTKVVA